MGGNRCRVWALVTLLGCCGFGPNKKPRSDFLTKVYAAAQLAEPETWPQLRVPPLSAFKKVAKASEHLERCLKAAAQGRVRPVTPLSERTWQVLSKVFGDVASRVGLVQTQTGDGPITTKGLACGTLLHLPAALAPKGTRAYLDTLARLLFEGTRDDGTPGAFLRWRTQSWAPWVQQACGVKAGPCSFPDPASLPAAPEKTQARRCEGSGVKTITASPGPTGEYFGAWRCMSRAAKEGSGTVDRVVPDGFGVLRRTKGTWIGQWKRGRATGAMLVIGPAGGKAYGPVRPNGVFDGVVMLPSALGFTRFIQYTRGTAGEDAWVQVGKGRFKGLWKGTSPSEGELEDADGARYKGRMCKGLPCGNGSLSSKTLTYDGRWRAGKPEGKGRAVWLKTGHRYQGSWKKGLPSGPGKLTVQELSDGKPWSWNGVYAAGQRDGKGVLAFDDCTVRGTWAKGRLGGETDFACTDFSYSGGMMGATPHGRGSLSYKGTGGRFRGRFHLGTLVEGTARWPEDSTHPLASFLRQTRKLVFPNKTHKRMYYKGRFRGVKPHGPGALYLTVLSGQQALERLVMEGEFDQKSPDGLVSLKACRETRASEQGEWVRTGCSRPWVVDGQKTTERPVFPSGS